MGRLVLNTKIEEMKKVLLIPFTMMCLLFLAISCQDEEPSLQNIIFPTELSIQTEIAGDQSGNVVVTPKAENAINFHVIFTPGAVPVVINPGQSASFRFTTSGQYSAPITVVAYGVGGTSSNITEFIDLDVRLSIAPEILANIAGGDGLSASSKRWVWDQTNSGHFGVGPLNNDFPEFFSASPNSLNPCLYDDVLVFSYDGNSNFSYELELGAANQVFINWTEVNRFFPDASPQQFIDECRDITDQASFTSNFIITEGENNSSILDVGNSFLSYWAIISGQYQITELSEDRMVVRGISQPFNGDDPLAWYSTFVPENGSSDGGNDSANSDDITFETLVWSEEFDQDGAPDPSTWNYDIGTGDNGWGNGESQYYTDRAENVIVENGLLQITAKRENFNGSGFTSSRIQSSQKFDFTFGRVEVRAKLPSGGGTWPAIWLLGSNFSQVGWPTCGEIDIMEHVGNQQDLIFGSTHDPNNFAGNARTGSTQVTGVSDDFHIYAIEWLDSEIRFFVDDQMYHTVDNNASLPFNKDFFFIMNVAIGGTFGGNIDPAFTQSSMEVDYIRVYQ
jgi:hypothetical protein